VRVGAPLSAPRCNDVIPDVPTDLSELLGELVTNHPTFTGSNADRHTQDRRGDVPPDLHAAPGDHETGEVDARLSRPTGPSPST
jgi:hypothetical protein